jgi:hypothetical protein
MYTYTYEVCMYTYTYEVCMYTYKYYVCIYFHVMPQWYNNFVNTVAQDGWL